MKIGENQKINSEIAYIKSIMQRSEMSFEDFKWFFLILTVYSFLSRVFLVKFRTYIYTDISFTGDNYKDLFVNPLVECVWNICALIPVLILIRIFHKKIKEKNQGLSLWLLNIIAFLLVFSGAVLPIAATAVSATTYEAADLFSIITPALCMLLCGVFTDNKFLKNTSYIYMAIPMVLLSVMGIMLTYYDRVDSRLVPPLSFI
ncbi:MAG: hypothetical protein J1E01_10660, partial [Acetatifactor sp.]|nr:hypothetical protein [Acetatifactor sp.]